MNHIIITWTVIWGWKALAHLNATVHKLGFPPRKARKHGKNPKDQESNPHPSTTPPLSTDLKLKRIEQNPWPITMPPHPDQKLKRTEPMTNHYATTLTKNSKESNPWPSPTPPLPTDGIKPTTKHYINPPHWPIEPLTKHHPYSLTNNSLLLKRIEPTIQLYTTSPHRPTTLKIEPTTKH
jgi:hypothetical protein